MKRKFLLLTLVILNASNLFAHQNKCSDKKNHCFTHVQNTEQNPSAHNIEDLDIFLTCSFIYWKPSESGLRLGDWVDDSSFSSDLTRFEYVDPKSKFKPGFKLGLGYNLNYDNWTLFLEYTRFHSTISNIFTRPSWGQIFLSNWYYPLFRFGNIDLPNILTSNWKIKYDIFDLELSCWKYRKTKLLFNLFFGIKTGFLDQIFITGLIDDTKNIEVFAKYNSWLIGPRVGVYTKYRLERNFSILAKIAASLSYQKAYDQKSETKDLNSTISKATISAKDTRNMLVIAEMLLGCNWGSYFKKNKYHFDIFAGYEAQFFWNQNFLTPLSSVNQIEGVNFERNHLNFQGMTLTVRLDF